MRHRHHFTAAVLIAATALISAPAVFADANTTIQLYSPTQGTKYSVPGSVMLQSTDGSTASPINSSHPLAVSAGAPLPASLAVTPADRGGTITTGATAQNAMGANTSRKGGWVQNPCNATEDLYVSTTTTATTTGAGDDADLGPCGTYSLVQGSGTIQAAVSVIAATTGHIWLAKETQ